MMKPNPYDRVECGLAWWQPKLEQWRAELRACADPDECERLHLKIEKGQAMLDRLWTAQRAKR